MRLPDFTRFTPDEKKAILALLLLTGGGSLVIEAGRHQPRWTPDLKLVAAAGLRPGAAGEDSTADDSTGVAPGGGGPALVAAASALVADRGAGAAELAAAAPEPGAAHAPSGGASPLPPLLAAALASTPEVVAAGMTPAADPARADAPHAAAPPAARAAPPAPADSAHADGRVDVNHADLAALGTLPGIGPKMAERIMADRQANGFYRRVEDLLRVKGIGPAKLAKLREKIVIRR